MTYKMTEESRSAALRYIYDKIENGVEVFMFESASHVEVLCLNALTFAEYVQTAALENLDKVMRLNKGGVELRKVVYESTRSIAVKALVRRGTMIVKEYTAGNWQAGEEAIAAATGGKRTGNIRGHHADLILVAVDGRKIGIEIKNCEGRLY